MQAMYHLEDSGRVRPGRYNRAVRRSLAPALLICLAWWALAYGPALLAGKTAPARDLAATQYPWRSVWTGQVRAGTPPLWDPLSNGGRPLLANPNAMAAYPGTLLFLLGNPEAAGLWHLALHHLLFLLGCYRLARRAGADPGTSAVAAAAAGTGGVAWATTSFLNAQASLAWVPWLVATALPAPPPGAAMRRRALAAGVLAGLAFLAGEPVIAALGALAWAAVALPAWGRAGWRTAPLAAAAALLVAAPVLVPLLALYPETSRGALGAAPGALAADALAPRRWPELLFPHLLGEPLGDGDSGFWAAAAFPWQRYYPVIFAGSALLLTLPLARPRRPGLRPFAWLAAGGLAGAVLLGIPSVAEFARRIPGLGSLRFGIKLLVLVAVALPPLVAAGAVSLRERWPVAGRRVCVGLLLAVVLLAPLALWPGRLARPALGTAYPSARAALAGLPDAALRRALALDLAALALPPAACLLSGANPAVLVAATVAANTLAARGALPLDEAQRWQRPPAALAALPAAPVLAAFAATGTPADGPTQPALQRFWRLRAALLPGYATRFGAGYVLTRGPDGLEPLRAELLAAAAGSLDPPARARIAAALGATAVVDAAALDGLPAVPVEGVVVNRIADAAPHFYLARRAIPAAGIPAAVQAMASPTFRPGLDAVVEDTGGAVEFGGGAVVAAAGPPHRLLLTVDADGPGLLVIQQSFLGAWRARVDGVPAAVEPVNGAMLGVRLPAGSHEVTVLLDPRPYQIGAAGPLLLLALWLVSSRARTSPGRAAASDAPARSSPASRPAP
jgi:hypothetical protein